MIRVWSAVPVLAKRFLLSKTSDGFLSFIAWVSVFGVALGVLALTVVTSVINGFEGELARVITAMNGDVVVFTHSDPVRDPLAIEQKIRSIVPETQAITHSLISELMISGPSGVAGSVLEGVDLKSMRGVTQLQSRLTSGRLPEARGEVALGSALAERIHAELEGEVRLILPFVSSNGAELAGDEDALGAPKVIKAKVVGVIRMGMYEYDSKFIFGELGDVQSFLAQPDQVNTFKLRLKSGASSSAAAEKLTDHFGYPFKARDWTQLNRNLFYAIQLEKAVISIILTVIVIVAAFNVVSTLMMMIHDKGREIAILKAMGLRPGQSFRLFVLIGLGMGFVGTFFGVGFGYLLCWILEKTRWIDLPSDIYYIGFLPVRVQWLEIGLIALLAITISFLATLYPGWQVSRRSPLEGLRYE